MYIKHMSRKIPLSLSFKFTAASAACTGLLWAISALKDIEKLAPYHEQVMIVFNSIGFAALAFLYYAWQGERNAGTAPPGPKPKAPR